MLDGPAGLCDAEINPVTEQPQPAVNSVLHDPGHSSRLVFSLLPGGRAEKPLPACNTLLNQPCRSSAY